MTVLKRFYIWNGEYNMGYCLQSKTGTTAWILNWLRISHLPAVKKTMELGLFSLPVSNFLIFIGIKLSFLIFNMNIYE